MKKTLVYCLISFVLHSCTSQQAQRQVGGPCEGCEALFEYGDKKLNPVDTLPGFDSKNPKVHIYGIVYQQDGKTPANDVIIYVYHTNRRGIYETSRNSKGWEKRHGIYRGWVKTDDTGKYDFYTFRPASYPNRNAPEHIHMTVKESDTNPYYIDDIMFTDDPLLTESEKNRRPNRAGSGIVTPSRTYTGNLLEVRRDIILGKNIPDY